MSGSITSSRGAAVRVAVSTLALLAVVVALASIGGAQTDPPAVGHWVVSDTTVVSSQSFILQGNLVVTSGGHLTLVDTEMRINSSFPGEFRILVETGGTLVVKDVDHNPSTMPDASIISAINPYVHYNWRCEPGSNLTVSASVIRDCGVAVPDQRGLAIETDDARIENSTFWSCNFGLFVLRSSPVVEDSYFFRNDGYGIYVEAGGPTIERCTLYDNYDTGIFIVGDSDTRVVGCTIRDHRWAGLFGNASRVRVEGCTFTNNTRYGVRFYEDCTGLVANCTVSLTEHVGIYLGEDCQVQIVDNEVHNVTNRGIWAYTVRTVVARNHVHHCSNDSMFIYNSDLVIMDNLFEHNGLTGLVVSDSNGFMVVNCTIRDNGNNGVYVGSLYTGMSAGTVSGCTIYSNGRAGIYVAKDSTCTLEDGNLTGSTIYGIYCEDGGTVEWMVRDVATMVNETNRFRGHIIVEASGELTVTSSVFGFAVGDGTSAPVEVRGTLVLLDGDGDRFTIDDSTDMVGTGGNALYPRRSVTANVSQGGSVIALNCYFERFRFQVSEGNVDVEGCEVQDTTVAFEEIGSGTGTAWTVVDCVFSNVDVAVSPAGTPLEVRGSSVSRSGAAFLLDGTPMANINNTTIITSGVGVLVLDAGAITLVGLRFLDCQDAVNASGTEALVVDGCDIKRSRFHGLRLDTTEAWLVDTLVSESGTGAVVADDCVIHVTDCQIQNNVRAGIMANGTELDVATTSVTATVGIGVWASGGSLVLHDSFLGTGEAYDLRVQDGLDARAINTHVLAQGVKALDTASVEVLWDMRVTVEVEGGLDPPTPLGVRIEDALGNVVIGMQLDDSHSTPWKLSTEFNASGSGVIRYSPYTVTVTHAGRSLSEDFDVEAITDHIVTIAVEVEAVWTPPQDVVEGDMVSLDGSASVAFPYEIVRWEWDLDIGTPGFERKGEEVFWTFGENGDYIVSLTVTDASGHNHTRSATVTVLDSAPTIFFRGGAATEAVEDEEVPFDGGYESGIDEVLLQDWDFGDGASVTGATVVHSWERAGMYTVTYSVYDSDGSTTSIYHEITILNLAPHAVVPSTRIDEGKGRGVFFDGASSWDTPSDNSSLMYEWDFDDGHVDLGAQVYHPFARAGDYSVILTVTDDDNATSTVTVIVTVTNQPPVVLPFPDIQLIDTDPEVLIPLAEYISDPDDEDKDLEVTVPEYESGGAVNIQVYLDDELGWVLKLDPVKGREGRTDLEFTVKDVDGESATAGFEVTVTMEDGGIIDWGGGSGMALIVLLAIVGVVGVAVAFTLLNRRGGSGSGD